MIIERPLETGQTRRRVWCRLEELHKEQDGIYSFVNLSEEAIGEGSEIIVMDSPGMVLFKVSDSENLLYNWTI